MVQSRTGSGKTAAFGIPFVNGDRQPRRQVRAGDRPAADARAGAAGRGRAGEDRASTAGSRSCPVYGGAPMGRQVEQLRDGGQIVVGTPGRVLDHLRPRHAAARSRALRWCSTSATRCCRWASRRTSRRSSSARPSERQTLLFSATMPEGIQRCARRHMRDARDHDAVAATTSASHEIHHVYYIDPAASARDASCCSILDFEEPEVGDHLLQHARRDRRGRRVPAQQGPRRRGDLARPVAERSRARDGPHARGRTSSSWSRPTSRRAASTSRTCRTSSTTRSPSRPRSTSTAPAAPAAPGKQGHRDLADRPARARVVLLPEAALQDQARGARAAVGGGDPVAPRGRAGPGAAPGAATAIRAANGGRSRGG